jgi:hypothetical protein
MLFFPSETLQSFRFAVRQWDGILQEKIHFTTLIYRRCLGFNLQPQNQVLSTHEL